MRTPDERNIDISGAFVGHVTTDEDSRALNMLTSTTIDRAAGVVTTEYRSAAHGGTIINQYTDPAKVRLLAYEVACAEQMAAATAYRMAAVTPLPKPKRAVIPTTLCPTCDGRKRFAGEPCPECLGGGVVQVRD
jgi:hypothetical protein